MSEHKCYHCGQEAPDKDRIVFDQKEFCCRGCQTVYEIFSDNGLSSYYEFERAPGTRPLDDQQRFDFLDNDKILERLLEFNETETQIVSLSIPQIHCSACVWVLENLNRLQPAVVQSQVNFPEKKVRINYNSAKVSLRELVLMLAGIGYEPNISLENYEQSKSRPDRSQVYKLGVAFFCFGNIMLLSFPEYFEHQEFWLNQYKGFFRWLIFGLSLPSFLYSASGYYSAAWNSLRQKRLTIEIPIALGIIVMFVRSLVDISFDRGPGFFDSMTGLVFFMLLGKSFQHKTYKFLNFERDFKSYFPIAVTRLKQGGGEESTPVYEIMKGDRILVRNQEIIPADGILLSENAAIDYSFVTGEALPVSKVSGDKIFAGGKLNGTAVEMEVLKAVSQSYLTQLWGNEAFQKNGDAGYRNITDRVSRYFTPILLLIAVGGFGYWIRMDADTAFNVFTAVLIVACPCALALTAPFTLGNILRIYGRTKFYLKNTLTIEQMSKIDTIVFDKTGTITTSNKSAMHYEGNALNTFQQQLIRSMLRVSNHPLSRIIYEHLPDCDILGIDNFEEIAGKGIAGTVSGHRIRIGSHSFAGGAKLFGAARTTVNITIDGHYYGHFIFHNEYRPGLSVLFAALRKNYDIMVLSGDNDGERQTLRALLSKDVELVFDQSPEQKLEFIRNLQQQGKKVMMVGDGLNDAGALRQSDVGIAIAENVNVFSPACDAILDASEFQKLDRFMGLSVKAIRVIKMSFALSLLYNVIGLSFAITGMLLPIVAAIIMPLSTVTIISFVTLAGNYFAYRLKVTSISQKDDKSHIFSRSPEVILTHQTNP